MFVPPQGSLYFNTAECNYDIDLLDKKCLLDLMEKCRDFHLISCEGIYARASNFLVSVEGSDSHLPFTDSLSPNSLMRQSRVSQEKCYMTSADLSKVSAHALLYTSTTANAPGDKEGKIHVHYYLVTAAV